MCNVFYIGLSITLMKPLAFSFSLRNFLILNFLFNKAGCNQEFCIGASLTKLFVLSLCFALVCNINKN